MADFDNIPNNILAAFGCLLPATVRHVAVRAPQILFLFAREAATPVPSSLDG
jgi:hypothetical protein